MITFSIFLVVVSAIAMSVFISLYFVEKKYTSVKDVLKLIAITKFVDDPKSGVKEMIDDMFNSVSKKCWDCCGTGSGCSCCEWDCCNWDCCTEWCKKSSCCNWCTTECKQPEDCPCLRVTDEDVATDNEVEQPIIQEVTTNKYVEKSKKSKK